MKPLEKLEALMKQVGQVAAETSLGREDVQAMAGAAMAAARERKYQGLIAKESARVRVSRRK